MSFVQRASSVIHREGAATAWWTFAGLLANAQLAAWIGLRFGTRPQADNLSITLSPQSDPQELSRAVDEIRGHPPFDLDTALDGAEQLKFRQCLPMDALWGVLQSRYGGGIGLSQVLDERIRISTASE